MLTRASVDQGIQLGIYWPKCPLIYCRKMEICPLKMFVMTIIKCLQKLKESQFSPPQYSVLNWLQNTVEGHWTPLASYWCTCQRASLNTTAVRSTTQIKHSLFKMLNINQCVVSVVVVGEHIWTDVFQCNRPEDDLGFTLSLAFWKLDLYLICH